MRLNLLRSKSQPPTMARTAPVWFSSTRAAASIRGSCSSISRGSALAAGGGAQGGALGGLAPPGGLRLRDLEAEPGHRAALQELARLLAVRPGDPLGAELVGRLADADA